MQGSFIQLFKPLPASGCGSTWGLLMVEKIRNSYDVSLRRINLCSLGKNEMIQGDLFFNIYSKQVHSVSIPKMLLKNDFTKVPIHTFSGSYSYFEFNDHSVNSRPKFKIENSQKLPETFVINLKIFHVSTEAILLKPVLKNVDLQSNHTLSSLCKDLKDLLSFGEHSDVNFNVANSETKDAQIKKAHRSILAARSPVFKTMFQNEMIEQRTGEIQIVDLSYEVMEIMLTFIYTGEVTPSWKSVAEGLAFAAEKYQIKDLQNFLDSYLVDACSPENAMKLLICARTFKLANAEASIKCFIRDNLYDYFNACLK